MLATVAMEVQRNGHGQDLVLVLQYNGQASAGPSEVCRRVRNFPQKRPTRVVESRLVYFQSLGQSPIELVEQQKRRPGGWQGEAKQSVIS